jgi:hypothetical protein
MPDVLSVDCGTQGSYSKPTAKDILTVAWTGMEMLLKKVEGCLGGTLAKTPVAAVNAIIDIKNVRGQSPKWIVYLLILCFRRLETTKATWKNSSFRLPKDSSPWIMLWAKVSPTLQSHE